MISKVLANRIREVVGYLVEPNQTAFIPGRLLQDGFLTAHEVISALHQDKQEGVAIMLDFAKARLMSLAEEDGWMRGIKSSRRGPSISHIQYADDTLVLCPAEESIVRGVRFICVVFEILSGLKINFAKSSILAINVDNRRMQRLADRFGCQIQAFPIRYLGLPLHWGKVPKRQWSPLINRFERRLDGWKSNVLSYGGKLTLLQSVLSNLPIFLLSIFKIPLGILETIEKIRRRFFWGGRRGEGNRIHLTNWAAVCSRKIEGGAGVLNLLDMNKALLCKWLWRWSVGNNLLWRQVILGRYGVRRWGQGNFPRSSRRDSPIWRGILSLAPDFAESVGWKVSNGETTIFWQDAWIEGSPLKRAFSRLFEAASNREASVRSCWVEDREGGHWQISFARSLSEVEREDLAGLSTKGGRDISGSSDVATEQRWHLHCPRVLRVVAQKQSTPSLGAVVTRNMMPKVPVKVRVFQWLLMQDRILTKVRRAIWSHQTMFCAVCVDERKKRRLISSSHAPLLDNLDFHGDGDRVGCAVY
ncbi:hypothetical protein QJS10_CPA05g01895 [Acorus calamus]|uniref:Uncharacterized protein n=1 Tax=Acorus calamus TaxID=4465 RepID=A0AAV9ERX9_ACOCL|nr:hypothetical protein QJS10_CPA05g01895 [Acorus calamus]